MIKVMTTKKIIFDSKNLPCDISDVEWVLKSDYDALKQLSDAFYLKQVQLENQNEDLKAKLEKAESVISFYASEDTWINKEFDEKNNLIGWTQKKPNDVSIFPYSIGNSNGNFHCLGRRAREYLKGEG